MKTSYVYIDGKHKYDLNEGIYDTRYLSALITSSPMSCETLGSVDASALADHIKFNVMGKTIQLEHDAAEVLRILLNNFFKEQETTINKGDDE